MCDILLMYAVRGRLVCNVIVKDKLQCLVGEFEKCNVIKRGN